MKTQIFKSLFIALTILLFSDNMKGQMSCVFPINNNLPASVIVQYTIYDNACLVICTTAQVTIPANNSVNVGSGCCGSAYDIEIYLMDIGGTAITTAPNSAGANISNYCNANNTSTGGSTAPGWSNGSSGLWSMNIGWGSANIN